MYKILNKIRIIFCILIFSSLFFTSSNISLSQERVSQQEIWSKKEKRARERARKKARAQWKKKKRAMERAKKEKLKQWKKRRKAEELTRARELARLQRQKLELKKWNLKLEEEKFRLEERKLREEEKARIEKARQEKQEQEIEKRKIALAERRQRAEELATTRELARLEREKQEIEKRKIALAERQQRSEELAATRELARLEEEKLRLEKQKIKAQREKQEIEKRKITLAERQQRSEELATTRELARLEIEKIRKEREKQEIERRKIELAEKQKRDEERAKARKLARFKREKYREKRMIGRLGERVENLLEKHTLTLDECIEAAMETHIQLKVAKKQLKLARFRLFEAKRNLGPSITVKWEESKGRVSDRLYTGKKFLVEGKQPIFYGGELVFSVSQARVNLEIVESDYDRIKNDLILQVKKAYYTLDKAKKALRIQEKLQDRTKTLFDMVKAGYEVAVIPQVEFLKISSQYNQASFQVISAKEDISVARLLLQQAMNIEEEIEIAGVKEPEPEIIELDLEDCFSLASLNRPEIKIGQLSLEYFRYEKKIMQARANWPRVDFLGSYGNTQEDYVKDDIDEGKNPRGLGPEYYFGTKISLPIWGSTFGYSYAEEEWTPVVQTTKGTEAKTHAMTFSLLDKLGDISSVKEADVEYMRSLDEINKKKQEITLEVKETFFKCRKAILLIDVAKSKVEFQTKQVEILEIRRELGEAMYSDVVEEMIKLAEEEFSYTQAISDYYISIASLNKAIGIDGYFKI